MDQTYCLNALSECGNINVQTAQLVTHLLKPILLKEVQTEYGDINKYSRDNEDITQKQFLHSATNAVLFLAYVI